MDSFENLKEKYLFHSQKQIERTKKAVRQSKFMEIAQQSNVKLLTLKKVLKVKMDEKKKEKYEKRLLMYKIANEEEEADYEKFFDENESECEMLNDEENNEVDKENEQDNKEQKVAMSSQEEENSNGKDLNDENSQEQSITQQNDNSENQSMDCRSDNLIVENRDLVTKMMNKVQQSQLDNDKLLGLCSAKVPANDFIDNECEDEDEDSRFNEESRLDDQESRLDDQESRLDDQESRLDDQESRLDDQESRLDDQESRLDDQESRLDDQDELNKSNDDESNLDNNLIDEVNDLSNDIFDNLNSQDSQFQNNRESTFLESRPDFGKSPFMNLKDFIEDQAELSEEDKDRVSSDEDEDGNDEYEQDEIDENLPSDDEILKVNNKIFLKQQMEEDKRELLEYQERFLEYGDLHDDGNVRQRKFKWKNIDNVWIDNVKDSSDSDEFDICDSQIEYTSLHLKQLSELDKSKLASDSQEDGQTGTQSSSSNLNLSKDEKRKKKLMNTSLNKTHLSSYSIFDNSIFNKHMRTFKRTMVNGPANDIKSYIIKDKNLVNAMSVKSSVVAANQAKSRPRNPDHFDQPTTNKKRKVEKNENKKSIFDLF